MPERPGPEYWNARAEEARAQASQMRDARAKLALLSIADNYDQLAEQADRRKHGRAAISDQVNTVE